MIRTQQQVTCARIDQVQPTSTVKEYRRLAKLRKLATSDQSRAESIEMLATMGNVWRAYTEGEE